MVPTTVAAIPSLPLPAIPPSPRAGRVSRGLRACCVISSLWAGARIDARVCQCSGLDLRDVFPTGGVAGRAERAARLLGRGLRRGAESDRSRPQPVVDGVVRFDQPVVPWIAPVEQRDLRLIGFTKEDLDKYQKIIRLSLPHIIKDVGHDPPSSVGDHVHGMV